MKSMKSEKPRKVRNLSERNSCLIKIKVFFFLGKLEYNHNKIFQSIILLFFYIYDYDWVKI